MAESVKTAFSRQSYEFDREDLANPILQYMRNRVREEVLQRINPGKRILELNAGTGLDATFFAKKGYGVLATEFAPAMVDQLRNKVKVNAWDIKDNLAVQELDFRNLDQIDDQNFDLIFSNFGGLNCTPDLEKVFLHFPKLLKPKGYVVLVIMPPICPWEISYALRGKFGLASRRLAGRSSAHLKGEQFQSWYFTPKKVSRAMPPGFKPVKLMGLGCLVPQPHMLNFPKRLPKTFEFLKKAEKKLGGYFPLNSWADHFMIVFQYLSGNQ